MDVALLGEDDPNELWMRLLIVIGFVAFGWIAERSRRAERRLRDAAERLNRLLRFVGEVKQNFPHAGEVGGLPPFGERSPQVPAAAGPVPEATAAGAREDADGIAELAVGEDDVGKLTRVLQDLSRVLDERFEELRALLQLTHEINMGLLLEEVLDKAYATLQSVLPYNRLSVALLEKDGKVVRARWAKADYPELVLQAGHAGVLKGSSLQGIIASGEPRIINDLAAYLELHPLSESTHLMVAEGIRSSLTCPLISVGKPIGFMFFSSLAADTYKNVHIDVFKLIAGHLSVMVEKSNLYQQILVEKENSEGLLLNVMPARIAARLRSGAKSVAENLPVINILFLDIVAFTEFASRHPPERVVHLLEKVFVPFDRLCVWGDAVNIASRMESSGAAGRIHVTEAIRAKLEGAFVFEDRGMIDVKGVGLMRTYFLTGKK